MINNNSNNQSKTKERLNKKINNDKRAIDDISSDNDGDKGP